MNIARKVAKNSGIVMVENIANTFIAMFVTIYLIKYLGSTEYGKYSVVYAYLFFFQILSHLGIDTIIVREVSRNNSRAEKLIANGITMKLMFSGFAILVSWIILQILGYSHEVKTFIYIASLSMLISFQSLYYGLFQAHLKMEYPFAVDLMTRIVLGGLIFLLIYLKATLLQFIILDLLIQIPRVFIMKKLSQRFVRPKLGIDLNIWKWLLRESWPLALTATFITIYTRIDQLMLFQMVGEKAVGLYAAIVRLTEFLNFIPSAFMVSVFPLFSQYFVNSGERFEKAYKLSFKYLATIIVPIAVGTTILAEPIIKLIFGEQFVEAAPALKILIWSAIFVFLGTVHLNILISAGLQKLDFIFTSSSAVVNVLLNLLLIPKYGIVGAAIATTVSYGLGVPLSYSLNKTRRYARQLISSTLKPSIAAAFMGLSLYYFLSFSLVVNILLSAAIYFCLIILLRGLDGEDFKYFRVVLVPA